MNFGTTVTNQNSIQEEIKRRLNSGNVCYHSVKQLLSSCLLSKNVKIRIYESIILPVALYECETWSRKLRDVHRLTVFENRVLRKIYGSKGDEVTGDWRKLQNEELHNFYSSPNTIRMIKSRRLRWVGYITRMGEENCIQNIGEKVRWKEPLERPGRRWMDNYV
jgi:hypothetical protein